MLFVFSTKSADSRHAVLCIDVQKDFLKGEVLGIQATDENYLIDVLSLMQNLKENQPHLYYY